MKNKIKHPQFPSIYRFITENKYFKKLVKLEFRLILQSKHKKSIYLFIKFLIAILMLIMFLGISLISLKLYKNIIIVRDISLERQILEKKINFWESFTNKYDGYKDAYFQIAVLEYRLGNYKKAVEYNKKALLLDPNFEDSKKLDVLLGEK